MTIEEEGMSGTSNEDAAAVDPGVLDNFMSAYSQKVAEKTDLFDQTRLLIDAEQQNIASAKARIAELTKPLLAVDHEVHEMVMQGQALGKDMVERPLPFSRRILAGLMSTASSPEKALSGAKNLAVLEALLETDEPVPIILADRFQLKEVVVGLVKSLEVRLDETRLAGRKVDLTLEQALSINRVPGSGVKPAKTVIEEQDSRVSTIPLSDFMNDVYSPDNINFERDFIDRPSYSDPGLLVGGLVIGAEPVSAFFSKYTKTFKEISMKTSLGQNPVFHLWLGLKRAGFQFAMPEGLQESWMAMATNTINETISQALLGQTTGNTDDTPFTREAYRQLGGSPVEEAVLVMRALEKTRPQNQA